MIRNKANIISYVTKDHSTIWELFNPDSSPVMGFSVAEALVGPGKETEPHVHYASQEIYYVLEGRGSMRLGGNTPDVQKGDAILIMPNTVHCIKNTGAEGLRILCICCPPYSHNDTTLEKN